MIQSQPGTNNFSWIPSTPLKKQGLESYQVDQDFVTVVGPAAPLPGLQLDVTYQKMLFPSSVQWHQIQAADQVWPSGLPAFMNQDHVCVSWPYQEDTDNFTTWSVTTIYLQQPIAYSMRR